MQDRAITAIGARQLEKSEEIEEVDLHIANMFPGKDCQTLLLVFEV